MSDSVEPAVAEPVATEAAATPEPTIDPRDAEIERLRKHNTELLGEKKSEQAKRTAAEEAAQAEQNEKLRKEGQWEVIANQNAATAEDWKGKYEQLQQQQSRAAIETEFHKNLNAIGVKPEAVPLLEGMMSQFEVGPQGPMTADGVPMNDYLKAWSETATAKLVIAAPVNSGGGNSNPGGASTGAIEGKNLTQLAAMMSAGDITQAQFNDALSKL